MAIGANRFALIKGLTFVFTGNLENVSRDTAIDLIKTLGGRVTGSVSSKTTYLVVGEILGAVIAFLDTPKCSP